jgi:hypothetical protein
MTTIPQQALAERQRDRQFRRSALMFFDCSFFLDFCPV